jgi:hypothetical protein
MHDQAHHEKDEEDVEQELGNSRRGDSYATEAKDSRNDRNHEEHYRIVKHYLSSSTLDSLGGDVLQNYTEKTAGEGPETSTGPTQKARAQADESS